MEFEGQQVISGAVSPLSLNMVSKEGTRVTPCRAEVPGLRRALTPRENTSLLCDLDLQEEKQDRTR